MARIRYVKPEFFTDSDLCELSPLHRLLFQGLWCHADRDGILEDKPRELKVKILPFDDCDAESMLADLARAGFIVRYEAGGQRLIAIPGMPEHQKFHKDEKPKGYPQPVALGSVSSASTVPAPSQHGASMVPAGRVTETGNGELKRGTEPLPSPLRGSGPPLTSSWPKLAPRLAAVFREAKGAEYAPLRSDEVALGRLLSLAIEGGARDAEGEVARRWRIALTARFRKATPSLTELAKPERWNEHAAAEEPDRPGPGKAAGDRPRL